LNSIKQSIGNQRTPVKVVSDNGWKTWWIGIYRVHAIGERRFLFGFQKITAETKCIGSIAELKAEIEKSVQAGYMQPMEVTDLHKPYVDEIVLVSDSGKPMKRVADLVDVWFDSGAMPYAQWHYPLENEGTFKQNFPADFIAEGVDQTRGWFFTLHVLGSGFV
jgi:isoleucyl-tRNA synthetase